MTFSPTPTTALNLPRLRAQFPALARQHDGRAVIFADGPGGTQVPQAVSAAMSAYLATSNANFGGVFATSRETDAMVMRTRQALAAFLNAAAPEEIIFGQNMTSLTFAMSRALARTWQAGDEIIVTALDHDANVQPWRMAAEDRGVHVRTLAFSEPDMTLSLAALQGLLSPRTRLVALTAASNAVGSKVELAPLIAAAHGVGALVAVDAVHFAPHGVIDVQQLDCDFLTCSAYKFSGPHLGIQYGRRALLESLTAYKVRPSSAVPPGKWETGTQNTEAIAGTLACLTHIAELAGEPVLAVLTWEGLTREALTREVLTREALRQGMQRIVSHEQQLSVRFLDGVAKIPGLTVHGLSDPARAAERTPTFGLTLAGITPQAAATALAARGIFVWAGHFYAQGVIEQLRLGDTGGLLRIGFSHYTTIDEVDAVVAAVAELRPV
jgi:cysteine desulfurase family protein (TIGR01976 family)